MGLEQHDKGYGVAGKRDDGEGEHDLVQIAVQQPEKSGDDPDDADDQRRPEQMFDGQRQGEEPAVDDAALAKTDQAHADTHHTGTDNWDQSLKARPCPLRYFHKL